MVEALIIPGVAVPRCGGRGKESGAALSQHLIPSTPNAHFKAVKAYKIFSSSSLLIRDISGRSRPANSQPLKQDTRTAGAPSCRPSRAI
jgi:hypothetical protein